ncbi:MAG: C_GCAxxG_C_C family protein [Bacteroidales bacterium]|nr:C_GCAxxG_C_C family protein [Bacteroidales bacterium]
MVKDHLEEALELFKSGYHCSQSVLAAFSEELGLPQETALKIACPFGGGLGGYGRTCGALTGAMMVVGLKYGATKDTDVEAKTLSRKKTRELIEAFEKAHGTSICNDLIGVNRSNFGGDELLAIRPIVQNTCPKFLETVITYLEEEL